MQDCWAILSMDTGLLVGAAFWPSFEPVIPAPVELIKNLMSCGFYKNENAHRKHSEFVETTMFPAKPKNRRLGHRASRSRVLRGTSSQHDLHPGSVSIVGVLSHFKYYGYFEVQAMTVDSSRKYVTTALGSLILIFNEIVFAWTWDPERAEEEQYDYCNSSCRHLYCAFSAGRISLEELWRLNGKCIKLDAWQQLFY